MQHDCTLGVVVCQRSQQLCGSGPPLRPNDNNRRPRTNKKAVDVPIVFSQLGEIKWQFYKNRVWNSESVQLWDTVTNWFKKVIVIVNKRVTLFGLKSPHSSSAEHFYCFKLDFLIDNWPSGHRAKPPLFCEELSSSARADKQPSEITTTRKYSTLFSFIF